MKTKLLAVLLVAVMMLTLTSCFANPKLDFDEAEDNLKDHDYTVKIIDDEDDLDVGIVQSLTAYSEDGDDFLYIIEYDSARYAKLAYKMIKQEYDAEVATLELEIEQIEYILDHYEDDLTSDEIDNYEDELKELKDELEETEEEYLFGIKGKYVWIGTESAIEDSKK